MMRIFDIETDGLLDTVTKVHCLVVMDTNTLDVWRFPPEKIHSGLQLLLTSDAIGGHNVEAFDLPVLSKLYDFEYYGQVFDTLAASRLIWPNIKELDLSKRTVTNKMIGSHSLKAWGQRLKFNKGTYGEETENAWETYSESMLDYCQLDVELNVKLYNLIQSKEYPEEPMLLEQEMNRLLVSQETTGFPFDEKAAQKLYTELTARKFALESQLVNTLEPTVVELATKTKVIPFNPASRMQIADRLQKRGWVPQEFTPSGEPKVDEKILSAIDLPEAALLTEFLMLNKRLGQLGNGKQAWLKLVKNGRLHGRVNHMGAVTSRCTHSNPNLGQVPSVTAAFGRDCRALFIAPEGYSLLGCDASGLELRCLAHYMSKYDGGAYGTEILEGDIHTANQKAAGLSTRDQAKTFIYAYLYGAGDEKIGSIVGGSASAGKKLKASFLRKTPALKMLREAIDEKLRVSGGNLKGLDGRIIPIRHAHAALNTLLQSAGAIICKRWYVTVEKMLREKGYSHEDVSVVAFVHDELQIVVKSGLENEIGKITEDAIKETERWYAFKCPLDSEFKFGRNWADTH